MPAPSRFGHVAYNTYRYREMIDWYRKVFDARVQYSDDNFTFLTYDDEHHRFAFVNLGQMPAAEAGQSGEPRKSGVAHVAYSWNDLDAFIGLYKRLKAEDIIPARPIKHGLTLSMYYADPDGNMSEFQIDVLDADAANTFMAGSAFAANPVGEVFDPDALVEAHAAGRPLETFIFRSDQDAGALPTSGDDGHT